MTESTPPCPLAPALAARIRSEREELTRRWLERISARVALDPNRVFPTDDLLDHVPLLLDGIAAYIEHPAQEVAADAPVIGKAMQLGALRHAQGFDEYEILKEFELLGSIVFAFLVREVRTLDEPCERDELLVCGHRLFRAIAVVQEASVAHYLQRMRGQLAEREARLRAFNRALTHELKNQIAAVLGASHALDVPDLTDSEAAQMRGVIQRNAGAMRDVLANLADLSRLDPNARHHRRVLLPQAAAEAGRQLRDHASASGVQIRLGALPDVEVPAAAVELALTNYLSNAIKYADRARPVCWAEVRGYIARAGVGAARGREVIVEVHDNGVGVPEAKRARLFAEGFRAHAETITGVEGTGLGLSIVRDAVEALGGRVWAAFPPGGGACFAFALPARRAADDVESVPPGGQPG